MKVVTFGEIMLRLKTPENLRIMQSDGFEASYGGAEANVAVSLAMYEDKCAFVSKVPNNPVGMSALSEVRHYGVNTEYMLRGGDRLGIYFFEKGSEFVIQTLYMTVHLVLFHCLNQVNIIGKISRAR